MQIRLKGIHVINTSPVIVQFVGIIKPFMKKHLYEMVRELNKVSVSVDWWYGEGGSKREGTVLQYSSIYLLSLTWRIFFTVTNY